MTLFLTPYMSSNSNINDVNANLLYMNYNIWLLILVKVIHQINVTEIYKNKHLGFCILQPL
jgi:hypothetical protein